MWRRRGGAWMVFLSTPSWHGTEGVEGETESVWAWGSACARTTVGKSHVFSSPNLIGTHGRRRGREEGEQSKLGGVDPSVGLEKSRARWETDFWKQMKLSSFPLSPEAPSSFPSLYSQSFSLSPAVTPPCSSASESLFWLRDCFYCPLHQRQESQRLFSVHRLAILQSGGQLFTISPFLGKDRTSPLLVKPYYYPFHVVSRSKQACSSFWVYTSRFKMYWPGIMRILSWEIRGWKSL